MMKNRMTFTLAMLLAVASTALTAAPAKEKEAAPAAEAEVVEEAAAAAEEAAEDVRCPQCGAQVSAGARFCGVCGAKMD